MPGLLAPQRPAAAGQGLEHIAVTDRGLLHPDPVLLHGQPEAEVGHDGDHHGVLDQQAPVMPVQRADGDEVVAVDQCPGVVHAQDPVGVTVEGQAGVGARSHDPGLQVARMRRAAAGVDVGAVGRGVDHLDGGPQAFERAGGPRRRRAVGAVDHQAQSGQGPVGHRGDHGVHPGGTDRRVLGPARHPRDGAVLVENAVQLGLQGLLDLVGELVATRGEELDAVVPEGVVGRRDHRAGHRPNGRGVRHGRGGHHAHVVHDQALGHQAGGQVGFEAGAGDAGVPADDHRAVAQDPGRGAPEGSDQFRGQFVGVAPDTIGAEPERHPASTAWSTAEPSGPS